MKKIEKIIGFVILLGALILGRTLLETDILYFRLVIGLALGYTLSRGYTGFAGSVNRAYKTGSTKLMRTMMVMFLLTTLLSTALLFNNDPTTFDLWVNPINLGLILGGLIFGFGMVFSSCCASGVLTDVVTDLPRGIITLLFFGLGVFVGFPLQQTATWITDSWATTEVGKAIGYNGVYLPDLFKGDGLQGYLGAFLLTALLCGIVIYLSYKYEQYRIKKNTYTGHFSEKIQEIEAANTVDVKQFKLFSSDTYHRLFVKPWTLGFAAIILAILFTLLMGVTKAGWGASTPYGLWFGKFLMIFGVTPESLASFSLMPEKAYAMPFFAHPINTQNFGIMIGTLIYLTTSSKFTDTFKAGLSINLKQAFFYIVGGFAMGFGTRLSNGCNVGALFTPIANYSLSGWVFFVFLVIGGIIGNTVAKKAKV